MRSFSNADDVIDSREVIDRIKELESDREALADTVEEAQDARNAFDPEKGGGDEAELDINLGHAQEALNGWDASNDAEELRTGSVSTLYFDV